MKKLIFFLIAALLTGSISALPVSALRPIDQRVEVITQLGLAEGDENGDLQLEKNITRAEMAAVLYRLMFDKAEPSSSSSQIFSDVNMNSWYAGYVDKLYQSNIIEGDDNGNFRPDDNVRIAESYIMLLRIAGYANYMNTLGDYPKNVLAAASETRLNDGISAEADAYASREQVFIMMYNLLEVKIMTAEWKNGGMSYKKGGKLMNELLDIYSDKGVIDGAAGISLSGSPISDSNVSINGETYINDLGIGFDSLGYYGDYYYREDDGDRILLSFIPKRNRIIEIEASDVIEYSDNRYSYYEGAKTKHAELYPGKDIVKNYKAALYEPDMVPVYGNIRLIDNDDDGKYDVVILNDYRNVLCSHASVADKMLYCYSNSDGSGKKSNYNIELDDYRDYTVQYADGAETELASIGSDTLLMLQEQENNELLITICDQKETGIITQISNTDDFAYHIDDQKYDVADSNAGGFDEVNLGDSVKIYLDKFGRIGAIEKSSDTSKTQWQYGFVIKSTADENEETAFVRMLDRNGDIKTYPCADKLRVDNSFYDKLKIREKVFYGQVIRYQLNSEGEVLKIDTPVDKSSYEHTSDLLMGYGGDNIWLKRCKGKMQYKSSSKALRRYTAMELEGQVFLDPNTVVFTIPDSDSFTEDADYGVRAVSSITENMQEKFEAYNDDVSSLTAQVLIFYGGSRELSSSSRLMIVSKYNEAIDKKGNDTYQIFGWHNGVETSYMLGDGNEIDECGRALLRGDIIRITVESGEIAAYELLWSEDGRGRLNKEAYVGAGSAWDESWRYTVGAVEYVKDDQIIFCKSAAGSRPEFYKSGLFTIYIYDPSKPRDQRIMKGSEGDIHDKERYPESYDTVVIGTAYSNGRELILIRNNDTEEE